MVATCSKVLMMPTELEALSSPDLPLYHALLTRGTSVAGTTCGTVCLPWNTIPGRTHTVGHASLLALTTGQRQLEYLSHLWTQWGCGTAH